MILRTHGDRLDLFSVFCTTVVATAVATAVAYVAIGIPLLVLAALFGDAGSLPGTAGRFGPLGGVAARFLALPLAGAVDGAKGGIALVVGLAVLRRCGREVRLG